MLIFTWHDHFFICLFFFQGTVSLCGPGHPGIYFVDQAGLELGMIIKRTVLYYFSFLKDDI